MHWQFYKSLIISVVLLVGSEISCAYGVDKSERCEVDLPDFGSFINEFDVSSCLKNSSEDDEDLSEWQRVSADRQACRCLTGKARVNPTLKELNNNEAVVDDPSFIKDSEESKKLEESQLSLQNNAIFNSEESQAVLQARDAAPTCSINECAVDYSLSLDKNSTLVKPLAFSQLEIKKEKSLPKDAEIAVVENKVLEEHCISGVEYNFFKSLPHENLIFKELSKKEFKPEEWDYKVLRDRYNEIMKIPGLNRVAHKEEIQGLKSKLFFLNANPNVKAFFTIKENSANFKTTNSEDKEFQKVIIESTSSEKLLANKMKLYNILQDFAKVNKKCLGDRGACLAEASKNGGAAKLHAGLQDFFSQKEVGVALKFNKDYEDEIALRENEPISSENWTRELILSKFKDNYPSLPSPTTCLRSSTFKVETCVEVFRNYCPIVRGAYHKMMFYPRTDDVLKDDVDQRIKTVLDITDLDKNEEFQKLNNELCHTRRKVNPSDEKAATFFDFKEEYCRASPRPVECNETSVDNNRKIRNAYLKKYKHPTSDEIIAFNDISNQVVIKNLDPQKIKKHKESFRGNIAELFDLSHFRDSKGFPTLELKAEKPLVEGITNFANAMGPQQSERGAPEALPNYVSNFESSSSLPKAPQESTVEKLSQDQRATLLDDWKEELASLKKSQMAESNSESAKTTEALMKERIAALEALLSQQKKLSETQYKLLNDALAAQSMRSTENSKTAPEISENPSYSPRKSYSYEPSVSDVSMRYPASVKDYQHDTAGSAGGSAASASLGRGSRGANALADGASSDSSIERESAKLVRLRQNSNGSITIESKGNQTLSPNAITVPISDDLYKMVQMNPTGLNLFQIEKSIPKEQIAELEKKEYIILLLQNGKNPPLEVKVKKENNRLVQVKNTQVVTRTFSLEGLQNTLKK